MPSDVIAGRFRLERILGHGGMSEVWLAHDLELERPVAVKLLSSAGTASRFEREARSVASLSHPNIVGVFDFGEHEGRPYLVLEYVPGGTLDERLSKPLSDEDVAEIARDIAAGLAHAHERGIVHRDLKPSNVLFDGEGRAKIADFGVARVLSDATLTTTGAVVGTAQYMAPEQATGGEVGPESDVYAFGVILFQLLTGRPPFESEHPVADMLTKSWQDAPAVESFRPDAPPFLAALAASALALDRHARPADGAALVSALDQQALPATAATAETAVIAPPPPPERMPPPRGRRRTYLAVAAAIGLLALVGFGASMLLTGGDDDTPATPESTSRATTGARAATTQTQPSATESGATTEDSPATTPPPPATEPDTTTTPPPTETAPPTTDPGTTTTAAPPATTTEP
ncbi:MAG TPA: serine/threonine-protein kinase [Gaiellaceae bacterium]|nr:serine/threonine-protein kinase [Gaiellaceae bacterium]